MQLLVDQEALFAFIKATGGGKGAYKQKSKSKKRDDKIFDQSEPCGSDKSGLGFGRLNFPGTDHEFKHYLRIPHTSDPRMVLCFMRTVWNLPSPKLIIGITGGAVDFKIRQELEVVLNEVMQITRETDAWIITGGTRGGIMKYFGRFLMMSNLAIPRCSDLILIIPRLQVKHDIDLEETFP
jgi:hypothetical protein